jgi:KUP system potassium uptake protein
MDAGIVAEQLFLDDMAANPPHRVRGTAVFMASTPTGIPNVLMHHMKHNQVLHRQVVLFSLETRPVPWVDTSTALQVLDLGHGIYRVIAPIGFMQTPDVPQIIGYCAAHGLETQRMTTTYYLGRHTLLTSGASKVAYWRKLLFSFLSRNARSPTSFFNLPPNRVVELGLQIEI